jgi:L-threonylcarbamoyladenylate synthase
MTNLAEMEANKKANLRVRPLRLGVSQSWGVSLRLKAATVLKAGGVVVHPTETCYGLAADIFNEKAVARIYALKKMRRDKPVSIMVRGLAEARKYAIFNKMALTLAGEYWPGPLTLVLTRKKALPAFLNRGHDTVGIRCPDSKVAMGLIKAAGGPLVTTSANISGKREVYKAGDYFEQIKSLRIKPDLVLDAGPISRNPPSTIIGFEKAGFKLIRDGGLWREIVKKAD